MTVLGLPGEGREEEIDQLATTEDARVASRFFEVSMRAWQLMMTSA